MVDILIEIERLAIALAVMYAIIYAIGRVFERVMLGPVHAKLDRILAQQAALLGQDLAGPTHQPSNEDAPRHE